MIALAIPRPELGNRAEARTSEIKRCLSMEADWILMLDLDQTLPEEAFRRFLEVSEWFAEYSPRVLIVDCPNHDSEDSNIKYHPNGKLAYFTISCCFIHSSIFDELPEPWFRSDIAFVEEGVKDGVLQWRQDTKYQDDNEGEDIYFSRKLIEAGIKVRVLDGLACQHYRLESHAS